MSNINKPVEAFSKLAERIEAKLSKIYKIKK